MLMFIFILVNKVSIHKILSLTGIFKYHLTPSYYIIGILFKNERTHSSRFFQGNKALYLPPCVHCIEAFEPAEALLIKTKMQYIICIES